MRVFFEGEAVRNPANKNSGKFVTLAEFLELAKTRAVPGVLISIKNAPYLAASKGLDIVDAVSSALTNASFDKQSLQRVLIQSDDSSVLLKFKDVPTYERVFYLEQSISGAPEQVSQEVKKYADAVFVHRNAIMVDSQSFASNFTKTVPAFHAANISVYVGVLRNEFENLIFDYLSDPYVEISTFYSQQVDGFVTDFPATANMFARSSCTTKGSPYLIQPVQPGFLFEAQPVAEPPLLSTADVVDPPLPPVAKNATAPAGETPPAVAPPTKSSAPSSLTAGTQGLLLGAFLALMAIFA